MHLNHINVFLEAKFVFLDCIHFFHILKIIIIDGVASLQKFQLEDVPFTKYTRLKFYFEGRISLYIEI